MTVVVNEKVSVKLLSLRAHYTLLSASVVCAYEELERCDGDAVERQCWQESRDACHTERKS